MGGGWQATVDMDVDDVDVEAPVVGRGRKPKLDRRKGAREKEREIVGELKRVVEDERERERLVLSEGVSSG